MARNRRGKKKGKKRQWVAPGGNGEDQVVASFQRLREASEEQQAAHEQERTVEEHPRVQQVDSYEELNINNIDFHADEALVLLRFRAFFQSAKQGVAPWNSIAHQHGVLGLSPDEAIKSVELREARPKRFLSQTHSGSGFMQVANVNVAELLLQASGRAELNCAPDGRNSRPARVRRSTRKKHDRSSKKDEISLAVAGIELIDVDFTEGFHSHHLFTRDVKEYPVHRLWQSSIVKAYLDPKSRTLKLTLPSPVVQARESDPISSDHNMDLMLSLVASFVNTAHDVVSRISIDLKSMKHMCTMKDQGSSSVFFLALRTRRPPKVEKETVDVLGRESTEASLDPSGNQAFACPTSYVCLKFSSDMDFRATLAMLKEFVWSKKVKRGTYTVSKTPSRHTAISHMLPTEHLHPDILYPLTAQGIRDAGDSVVRILYALECLLRHGNLRVADIQNILQKLLDLSRLGKLQSVSKELENLVDSLCAVHHCNNGDEALRKVSEWHAQCTQRRATDEYWAGVFVSRVAAHHQAQLEGTPVAADAQFAKQDSEDDEEEAEQEDEEMSEKELTKEGLVYLRKVLVTPLRVLPYPETIEESNRIIRQYSQFSDRFLRIGFANDRLSGLAYFDLGKDLLSRLKDIMLHGLHICNRTFIFLGYSNSQLRDHACWLYCEEDLHLDGAPTAAHIRASAGDLSNILIPAKHAARLAQCFSSTYETFRLSPDHICKIPEVVAQGRVVRNSDGVLVSVPGEEFSDGVGVITSEGMQLVIKNLPSRQQQRLIGCDVAAIQIRMGGCKGVLARWDNHSDMIAGALVGMRQSMSKFDSKTLSVEVCSVAKVMPCYINRQVIMALLSLGIHKDVFWNMYVEFVKELDRLLEGGPLALMVLKKMGCDDPSNTDSLHVSSGSLAACMIAAGILPKEDELLLSLVQSYRSYALKGVQDKCRMPVQNGANLLGIMDETGALPHGTFYASWDASRDNRGHATAHATHLPPGTQAVVSRAPCMDPADVRVLTAADPATLPASLTSLKNVIVFPNHGPRPEPCKMSGGDLDGDIYFIIWEPSFLPAVQAEELDYTPPKNPVEVPGGVQVEHIVEFFLNYLKNDQLGRIANGHLSAADGAEMVANGDVCKQLVMLHSVAVDFAKTGVPVDSPEVARLMKGILPPDYLGGKRISATVIGEIYRDAKERNESQQTAVNTAQGRIQNSGSVASFYYVPGSEAFMEEAGELVLEWSAEFSQMMSRYEVSDVGQVITGRVLEFYNRPGGKEKNHDHQQRLNKELARIRRSFQRACLPDLEPADAATETDTDVFTSVTGAGRRGRSEKARAIAQRMQALAHLEDTAREEVICRVSALYQAAYQPVRQREVSEQEALIRMALPWHMAPRLLALFKEFAQ